MQILPLFVLAVNALAAAAPAPVTRTVSISASAYGYHDAGEAECEVSSAPPNAVIGQSTRLPGSTP